ncbi:hypothetical protein, partial [Hydrogenivirga sp.]
ILEDRLYVSCGETFGVKEHEFVLEVFYQGSGKLKLMEFFYEVSPEFLLGIGDSKRGMYPAEWMGKQGYLTMLET